MGEPIDLAAHRPEPHVTVPTPRGVHVLPVALIQRIVADPACVEDVEGVMSALAVLACDLLDVDPEWSADGDC